MGKTKLLLNYIGIILLNMFINILALAVVSIVLEKINIPALEKSIICMMFAYVLGALIVFNLLVKVNIFKYISFSKINLKLVMAIIIFFICSPIVFQDIFVWGVSLFKFSPDIIEKLIENEEYIYSSLTSVLLGIVLTAIVAPIVEELIFRAFSIEMLKREFKIITTIVISSFFFTIVHSATIQNRIEIFISAIIIGVIYIKTNNVIYCIIAHAIHNSEYVIFNYLKTNNINTFNQHIIISSTKLEIYPRNVFIIAFILMIMSFVYLMRALMKKNNTFT